jgi:hypothetical protein
MTEEAAATRPYFEGQFLHVAALAVLLAGLYTLKVLPGLQAGEFIGLSTFAWMALAVVNAIVHQVFVWFCWRVELHGKALTRWFGGRAFVLYSTLFAIMIVVRPILAFLVGWSNRGTLNIEPWVGYGLSLVLFLLTIFLVYSIVNFFSFSRALGIDHFDPAFRQAPLIRQGIFRWSPNAMYVFGFVALWIPAFLFQSIAALVIAAFSHLYIWVHYFATEKPDMIRIYGK